MQIVFFLLLITLPMIIHCQNKDDPVILQPELGKSVELDPALVAAIKSSVNNDKNGDENMFFIPNEDAPSFGQKIKEKKVEEKKEEKKVEEKPIRGGYNITNYRLLRKTQSNRPYSIYDGIIPDRMLIMIKHYLTFDRDAWLFSNYDNENKRTSDNTPWINNQDPLSFSKTRLCKRFLRAVHDTAQDTDTYYPYKVYGKIIRRGDHTKVYADSQEPGDYSVMVFVNEFWRKNYYGELYLYDNNREIIGGATHKSARVVVWESTILRLNRPPAVQFLQGQILLHMVFSKNKDKMLKGHEEWLAYQKERQEASDNWNLPDYKSQDGSPFTAPDPSLFKKFEFSAKTDGRKIVVFDKLFSDDMLNHLRSFVLNHGTYFYDDSVDEDSDNVQWIAGFLLKPYLKSPFWKIIQKAAAYVSGNNQLFPYDVSINVVRNSDHTRIHKDVGYHGEEEFTCVVYMNPNWTKNDYGETTFFEKSTNDNEIIAQVRPRYGRTVIFDGNIPHSARPPSFNFSGARLTFVTKLHKNEYTGRKKNFKEEMRHVTGLFNILDEVQVLSGKNGEKYAARQLKQLRQLKEKLSKRVGLEENGEGEQEDNGQENDEQKDNEQEGDTSSQTGDMPSTKEIPTGEEPFYEEDMDELPPVIQAIYTRLEGVTEKSSDGVKKIIDSHEQLIKVFEETRAFLQEAINKFL